MKIVLISPNGDEVIPEGIVSIILSRDEDAPCDSLDIVFSGAYYKEFSEICLFDENGFLYRGVVDEQIVYISQKEKTQFISRSREAILVDNEACPLTLNYPDTELIFKRYLKPLGLESFEGKNRVYEGKFKVSKGMSCFSAAESFSQKVYGASPKIRGSAVVFEEEEKPSVIFTDDPGLQGVFYGSMEYSLRRYCPVSHIWVKTETSKGYDTLIRDKDAEQKGIFRQRYLNASVPSSVSISQVDEILSAAKSKFYTVTLRCPSAVPYTPGRKAQIHSEQLGVLDGYLISSVRYTYRNSKEETRIVLRRES